MDALALTSSLMLGTNSYVLESGGLNAEKKNLAAFAASNLDGNVMVMNTLVNLLLRRQVVP
jgi:hypothetical protein